MTDFTSFSRRTFLALCASMAVLPTAPFAKTFETNGIAIHGTDPVAYFTESKAVAGSSEFTTEWNGSTWQFSSAENKDLFVETPEKYAPQYGGFCAYAVAKGSTASSDPEAWTIHDGKLYLNYSKLVRGLWARDIPGNITKADANWPNLQ